VATLNNFCENSMTRDKLEALLKKGADLIRTKVDYKYLLLLLFLKRVSDKWNYTRDKLYREFIEEGFDRKTAAELAEDPDNHDFYLPHECRWEYVRENVNEIPERLSKAFKRLADENPQLKGVIDRFEFMEFTINRENLNLLSQLVELFSTYDLSRVSPDVLGDAYEWVIRYFAPQKAKEGEVYTPREVVKLLIEMLDPKPGEDVYDPACGSGGMLITSYKHVEERYGRAEAKKLFLYGQENNPTTYALAEMNMILHGILDTKLEVGDTLERPRFKEGGYIKRFDVVVANPPWNQDGYGEERLKKAEFSHERFPFGYPPNNSADWAWIQHMLASCKETGKVGIVIDNGALFRGGREKKIRKRVLEKDLLECVILLPEKLFYNTGAPGAIMIFSKNKEERRRGKVLFINASGEYDKHPEVRKLNILADENIERIASTYRDFREEKGFSRIVDLKEIKDNDYNLNVTLYVFPEEEIEEIDVEMEWRELKEIEKEIDEIEKRIEAYLEVIQ